MIALDAPRDLQLRDDQVRLGLWMFLATVTMLFAAFVSAYIVRRSGSDWRHVALPPLLWVNTAILAASSVLLEAAQRAGRRRMLRRAEFGVALTFAMGLIFLAGQVTAWKHLVDAGVYLPTSPHSAFFYMITAAHGVHVVAALAVLAWGLQRIHTASSDPRTWAVHLDVCRTFWHYLGGLWIVLLLIMSEY